MSAPFVVDASVAATWCFPTERSVATETLRTNALQSYILVPPIFPSEVQNILRTGELRRRISAADADAFWVALLKMDIRVVASNRLTPDPELLVLARKHNLSAYDASYLQLAQINRLPIATLDRDLRNAAAAVGLIVLPA